MPRRVAVLFVHGIYNSDQNYHRPLQERIVRALPRHLRAFVDFEPANWAPIVRERQRDYMNKLLTQDLVQPSEYRRLALEGLGDAAAYQKTRNYANSSYFQIQAAVRAAIDRLDERGEPDRPLVFIGHSLGCHILSTFAWDTYSMKRRLQERIESDDEPMKAFAQYLHSGSPFRRLDTLAGFITMGCNIPLFTFTFGPERIIPITKARHPSEHPAFPGAVLSNELKAEARWLNYYSRHDLLGYPLKPLSSHYMAEERLTDIEVMSEGRLLRALGTLPWLSPLACKAAHTNYWTNGRVSRGAADMIARLITAGDPASPSRFPSIFSRRGVRPSATAPASGDREPLPTA